MFAKNALRFGCLLAAAWLFSRGSDCAGQVFYPSVAPGVYVGGYAAYPPPYAYGPRRAYRYAVRYGYPAAPPIRVYVPGGIYGYPYYGYPNHGYLYRPPHAAQPAQAAPPTELPMEPTTPGPEPIPAPPSEP